MAMPARSISPLLDEESIGDAREHVNLQSGQCAVRRLVGGIRGQVCQIKDVEHFHGRRPQAAMIT
jgi:hypothetical protein